MHLKMSQRIFIQPPKIAKSLSIWAKRKLIYQIIIQPTPFFKQNHREPPSIKRFINGRNMLQTTVSPHHLCFQQEKKIDNTQRLQTDPNSDEVQKSHLLHRSEMRGEHIYTEGGANANMLEKKKKKEKIILSLVKIFILLLFLDFF